MHASLTDATSRSRSCRLCLVFVMLAALWATASAGTPSIRIEPGSQVLDGDAVHVTVVGAPPGTEVTLTAERWFAGLSAQRSRPRLMRSEAVFAADQSGRVELRTAQALSGTYRGVDPRGLFWSMLPVSGIERAPIGSVDTSEVRFRLQTAEGRDEARVQLLSSLPEVSVQSAEGLPGAVFAILPSEGRRPAVILLGGSELRTAQALMSQEVV